MSRVVSLESIDEAREARLFGRVAADRVRRQSIAIALARQTKLGGKIGKRPVGSKKQGTRAESLNETLIRQSPGSSQNTGLDFVKAVYAERTGQEPMY